MPEIDSDLSQSSTATSLLVGKLKDTNAGYEHGELVFGYNLRDKTGEVRGGSSEKVWMQGEGTINRNNIDLADFGAHGGAEKGWKYFGMNHRDENMARVFEHEYLGHHHLGIMAAGDGNATQMGRVVEYTNLFRRERGILERLNYGGGGSPIVYGKTSDFNSTRELIKYIQAVNKGKISPTSYRKK
ncbi:hypothetical protein ACFQ21_19215 [Ohtaekwangia kribbensis]|uniref:Bacterial toxin 44 domain-containing protein n=1 Tax=Ohtaekwangia kribbensis TaxID=688913 RepID=A0ABW3K5P8_9BACT